MDTVRVGGPDSRGSVIEPESGVSTVKKHDVVVADTQRVYDITSKDGSSTVSSAKAHEPSAVQDVSTQPPQKPGRSSTITTYEYTYNASYCPKARFVFATSCETEVMTMQQAEEFYCKGGRRCVCANCGQSTVEGATSMKFAKSPLSLKPDTTSYTCCAFPKREAVRSPQVSRRRLYDDSCLSGSFCGVCSTPSKAVAILANAVDTASVSYDRLLKMHVNEICKSADLISDHIIDPISDERAPSKYVSSTDTSSVITSSAPSSIVIPTQKDGVESESEQLLQKDATRSSVVDIDESSMTFVDTESCSSSPPLSAIIPQLGTQVSATLPATQSIPRQIRKIESPLCAIDEQVLRTVSCKMRNAIEIITSDVSGDSGDGRNTSILDGDNFALRGASKASMGTEKHKKQCWVDATVCSSPGISEALNGSSAKSVKSAPELKDCLVDNELCSTFGLTRVVFGSSGSPITDTQFIFACKSVDDSITSAELQANAGSAIDERAKSLQSSAPVSSHAPQPLESMSSLKGAREYVRPSGLAASTTLPRKSSSHEHNPKRCTSCNAIIDRGKIVRRVGFQTAAAIAIATWKVVETANQHTDTVVRDDKIKYSISGDSSKYSSKDSSKDISGIAIGATDKKSCDTSFITAASAAIASITSSAAAAAAAVASTASHLEKEKKSAERKCFDAEQISLSDGVTVIGVLDSASSMPVAMAVLAEYRYISVVASFVVDEKQRNCNDIASLLARWIARLSPLVILPRYAVLSGAICDVAYAALLPISTECSLHGDVINSANDHFGTFSIVKNLGETVAMCDIPINKPPIQSPTMQQHDVDARLIDKSPQPIELSTTTTITDICVQACGSDCEYGEYKTRKICIGDSVVVAGTSKQISITNGKVKSGGSSGGGDVASSARLPGTKLPSSAIKAKCPSPAPQLSTSKGASGGDSSSGSGGKSGESIDYQTRLAAKLQERKQYTQKYVSVERVRGILCENVRVATQRYRTFQQLQQEDARCYFADLLLDRAEPLIISRIKTRANTRLTAYDELNRVLDAFWSLSGTFPQHYLFVKSAAAKAATAASSKLAISQRAINASSTLFLPAITIVGQKFNHCPSTDSVLFGHDCPRACVTVIDATRAVDGCKARYHQTTYKTTLPPPPIFFGGVFTECALAVVDMLSHNIPEDVDLRSSGSKSSDINRHDIFSAASYACDCCACISDANTERAMIWDALSTALTLGVSPLDAFEIAKAKPLSLRTYHAIQAKNSAEHTLHILSGAFQGLVNKLEVGETPYFHTSIHRDRKILPAAFPSGPLVFALVSLALSHERCCCDGGVMFPNEENILDESLSVIAGSFAYADASHAYISISNHYTTTDDEDSASMGIRDIDDMHQDCYRESGGDDKSKKATQSCEKCVMDSGVSGRISDTPLLPTLAPTVDSSEISEKLRTIVTKQESSEAAVRITELALDIYVRAMVRVRGASSLTARLSFNLLSASEVSISSPSLTDKLASLSCLLFVKHNGKTIDIGSGGMLEAFYNIYKSKIADVSTYSC